MKSAELLNIFKENVSTFDVVWKSREMSFITAFVSLIDKWDNLSPGSFFEFLQK